MTISLSPLQWYKILSNMNCSIVLPVSQVRAFHFGHLVSKSLACTIYLCPWNGGMCIVLIYAFQKSGAGI